MLFALKIFKCVQSLILSAFIPFVSTPLSSSTIFIPFALPLSRTIFWTFPSKNSVPQQWLFSTLTDIYLLCIECIFFVRWCIIKQEKCLFIRMSTFKDQLLVWLVRWVCHYQSTHPSSFPVTFLLLCCHVQGSLKLPCISEVRYHNGLPNDFFVSEHLMYHHPNTWFGQCLHKISIHHGESVSVPSHQDSAVAGIPWINTSPI